HELEVAAFAGALKHRAEAEPEHAQVHERSAERCHDLDARAQVFLHFPQPQHDDHSHALISSTPGRPGASGRRRWRSRPGSSSRNSTLGVCSSPRAISRRRFMPPENVFTRSSRRSHSSNIRSNASHRSRRTWRGTWYSTPWMSMFSHAVSSLSRLGSWNTTPKRRRTSV